MFSHQPAQGFGQPSPFTNHPFGSSGFEFGTSPFATSTAAQGFGQPSCFTTQPFGSSGFGSGNSPFATSTAAQGFGQPSPFTPQHFGSLGVGSGNSPFATSTAGQGFSLPYSFTSHPFGGSGVGARTTAFATSSAFTSVPAGATMPSFGVMNSAPGIFAATTNKMPAFTLASTSMEKALLICFEPNGIQSVFASAAPVSLTPISCPVTSDVFRTNVSTPSFGPQSGGFAPFANNAQHGGTGVVPYAATREVELSVFGAAAANLMSMSAMPFYKGKCHEELRWEDYMLGNKGKVAPLIHPTATSNPSDSSPAAQYFVIGPFYPLPVNGVPSHSQPTTLTNIGPERAANVSPVSGLFSDGNAPASVPDATRTIPSSQPSSKFFQPCCRGTSQPSSHFSFTTSQSPSTQSTFAQMT
ncbi:hypothetical protein Droror1_Dr00022208 [Drosera rotundifolia]